LRLRPKVFLNFLAIVLLPLLIITGLSYWSVRRVENRTVAEDSVTTGFSSRVTELLDRQEDALVRFAHSQPLRDVLTSPAARSSAIIKEPPSTFRAAVGETLNQQNHFAAIGCFDQNKQQAILAERYRDEVVIRDKDFLPGHLQPDEKVWTSKATVRSSVSRNPLRAGLQISVPVVVEGGTPIGAVVGEVDFDSLLRAVADQESRAGSSSALMVTDDSGTILYHPNPALSHQQVSALGQQVRMASSKRIPGLNLFVATVSQPGEVFSSGRLLLASLLLSLVLAAVAAFMLTRSWERRNRGIEKVTAGVAAIVRGDLDHRIEALSSDAIRPMSDNLNLMTAQLREQIAREAEARQFQSFVRLSAMLTHDLKNAIEALSLIVSNMERHFDNEAFRADAMKSLNLATQNLRSLVDRLTHPVTTLSGEYKRPQPVDLVPMLNRVIKLTAAPALSEEQIKTSLPETLPALVDAERIEKVIENLILNAVEAMAGTEGKLEITAGLAEQRKVFFSVSDNGPGMSSTFIERQLFRPFATTKKRGVGLGLYTCREVVRTNGGTIEVDSSEGAGTTFRVVLPSPNTEKI
jgi:signal transduction histidine kinase